MASVLLSFETVTSTLMSDANTSDGTPPRAPPTCSPSYVAGCTIAVAAWPFVAGLPFEAAAPFAPMGCCSYVMR